MLVTFLILGQNYLTGPTQDFLVYFCSPFESAVPHGGEGMVVGA